MCCYFPPCIIHLNLVVQECGFVVVVIDSVVVIVVIDSVVVIDFVVLSHHRKKLFAMSKHVFSKILFIDET